MPPRRPRQRAVLPAARSNVFALSATAGAGLTKCRSAQLRRRSATRNTANAPCQGGDSSRREGELMAISALLLLMLAGAITSFVGIVALVLFILWRRARRR